MPEEEGSAPEDDQDHEGEEEAETVTHDRRVEVGGGARQSRCYGPFLSVLQECGESAVDAVLEGEELVGFFELQLGMFLEEGRNLAVVFIGLDRTGRIHEASSGFETGERVVEDLALDF